MSDENQLPDDDVEISHYDAAEVKEAAKKVESKPSEQSAGPALNFTIEKDPVTYAGAPFAPTSDYLSFLALRRSDADKIISASENKRLRGDKEQVAQWKQQVQAGAAHAFAHPHATAPTPFDRPGADWGQSIEHNGEYIRPYRPRAATLPTSATGDEAILLARSAGRLGTTISLPLPHTGIWVSIKAPVEDTLLQVEHAIERNKIALGSSTVGGIYSNSSVYMFRTVINMVLDHIYESTFFSLDNKDLRDNILITDAPLLIGATAAAIYVNGYELSRPCVANPEKCHHIDTGKVAIGRMIWFDRSRLSTYQKNHLNDVDATHSVDHIKKYQLEHSAPQHHVFNLNEDIKIHVSVPTIGAYIRSGVSWVDGIINMIDATFKRDANDEERDSYIAQHGVMTRMRKYTHWVSKITLNETTTITDVNTIESVLSEWSGDDDLYKTFCENIENFISNAVIGAVGIPTHECSACDGKPNPSIGIESLPGLIEVEPLETFFTLQFQTLSRILNKQ